MKEVYPMSRFLSFPLYRGDFCFFVLKFIDKYNTIYSINRHEEERRFTNKHYWRLETALLISTGKAGN